MTEAKDLGFHIARGSAWAMAARWSNRVLGLINTVVLARLLTPSDFGVVAIAMLIAGAIEIFGQTGQWLAIIRHPSPTRAHYDSAWTVSLILNLVLGSLIWLAAPASAIYFHEPRAGAVVHIVAFRTILAGLENIGIVNFQRGFRFRALSFYNAVPSLVSFVLTLASAVVLRNYWALVIGIMSQQVTTIALSYVLEPYRPRVSFAKVREIWSFSVWTLVRTLGLYLNDKVDKFAIGGFAGAATMGRYEVASDVATAPTLEINTPIIATLFPVMSKVQDDPVKRRELYLKVLYWSALICTSTSVGVALVSNDAVDLIFGSQWGGAKPLFPWLALAFGTLSLSASVNSAFNVIGKPEMSARIEWARLGVLTIFIAATAFFFRSALSVAIMRFVVTVAVTPVLFAALARVLELDWREIASALWRPLAASLAMAGAVIGTNALLPFLGPARLVIDVGLGATTYFMVVIGTWIAIGKPEGPEALVWSYLGAVPRMSAQLGKGK